MSFNKGNPYRKVEDIYKQVLQEVGKLMSNSKFKFESKLEYPNGDIFEGERNRLGMASGQGVYYWNEGFKYDGEFFLNEPYGHGTIEDVFGNKLQGYVFRGYVLKQPYGLDELAKILQKEIEDGKNLKTSDLDIISDPELMLGSSKFREISISYGKIYHEIKENRKIMNRLLENIRDGEEGYKNFWCDILRGDVRQLLMSEDANVRKILKSKKYVLWRFHKTVKKTQSKIDIKMKKSKKNFAKLNISVKELKCDLGDLNKFKKNKSNWKSEQIAEMIRDEEFNGVKNTYELFKSEGKELEFFNLRDMENRNLLMIAAHLGHRKLFVDMMTALRMVLIKSAKKSGEESEEYKKTLERILDLFKHTDNEENNIVDLACIRGFSVQEEEIYSYKVEPVEEMVAEHLKNLNRKTTLGFSKLRKKNFVEIQENYRGPHIYLEMNRLMRDSSRELFSDGFMTYQKVKDLVDHAMEENMRQSSKIFFVSSRSIILDILFKFCWEFDIDSKILLNKEKYDEKKNNPLHFTIFWGDLHATLKILDEDNSIMFWRNEDNELPPHIIRFSGDNFYKANAVFATVLQEITRHFNFKMISELLIGKEKGVLQEHQDKIGVKFQEDEKDKETAEKIKNLLSKGSRKVDTLFDEENIFLYKNNYILKSDELCKQYLKYLKRKSSYRQLKREFRVMKKSVFTKVSELESLQRNFLDYYKGSFKEYHSPEIVKKYKEDVQELLTWYVFIFGDAEIEPEIYSLLGINPFDIVLGGRNIFHFMCENNSYSLLNKFVNYLYEKCHTRPFDISIESYEDWDEKTLDKDLYAEFKEKLNTPTRINQNTAAHLCVFHNSDDCLKLLLNHNIDIDYINIRGRTVREFLAEREPYNLSADMTLRPGDISKEIVNYLTMDILTTCKQHSLKFEYFEKAKHEDLQKVLRGSLYQLNEKLSAVRDSVMKKMKDYGYDFKKSREKMEKMIKFLEHYQEIKALDECERFKEINRLRTNYFDPNEKDEKRDKLSNEMIYYLITALEGERLLFIPQRDILETLFDPWFLRNVKWFKYKKYEKMMKREFLTLLDGINFSEPIPRFLKHKYSMDKLFCIEIKIIAHNERMGGIKERDLVEKNIVVNQINNIRRKYMQYGGGIRVEIIKGFSSQNRSWKRCFRKGELYQTYFLLITISDTLLKKIATEKQMEAYNYKRNYHTVFFENAIDSHELEPLRHFQKIKIMMELINNEFDIDRFKKKGLITKYFPVHDYKQRKLILKLWSKYKYLIHFKDAFLQTDKNVLLVPSLISFYHGIQQGFYFGFLSLYTNAMFYIAILGLIATLPSLIFNVDMTFLRVFSPVIIGLWSTFFLNMWQRREKELAFSFDSMGDETIKTVRKKYRGSSIIDEGTLSISKKVKERWVLKGFLTFIIFVLGSSLVLAIYLLVNSLNNQLENSQVEGNARTFYGLGIGFVNALLNFVLAFIYEYFVNKFVVWENHA